MDHGRRSNWASTPLGHSPDRAHATRAALLHDGSKQSGAAPLPFIPICLVLFGFAAIVFVPPETKPPVTPVQVTQPNDVPMGSAAAAQKQTLEERDPAERERAADEQSFLARRNDIDAIKTSSAHEENLPRELAEARQELVAEGVEARNTAEASLARTKLALDEERRKVELLEREIAEARQAFEVLEASAKLAATTQAGAIQGRQLAEAARNTAEVSLAGTRRALEEERRKVALLERDIAEARQSIEALEASAKLAATTQAGAIQGRQLADAAARQAGEALARERERASSLASDLETARQERDSAKKELTRISTAFKEAWEQEREKAIGLARDLASARKDVEALKRSAERRTSQVENAAKARPIDRASARASQRRSSPNSGQQEVGSAEVRKSRAARLMTIVLPDALLPTRPPAEGLRQ